VHPGSARCGGPATPRPAAARAPAAQPHIGKGVMGGANRACRDQGRPVAGEPSDTIDARGINGFLDRLLG
jgi:hypothetical protein